MDLTNHMVPKKMFFTRGVGYHKEELRSFELALRSANISMFNLVYVSSILPPNCKIISKAEGLKELSPGQIVFCVMARCASNESRRLVSSSIGCAIPAEKSNYGYLSEYHGYGQNEKQAGDYSEDLAASMLASAMGLEFDDEKNWDEKEQFWKFSGQIVRTTNTTQTAIVDAKKGYTTVVASAILLL